MGIIIRLLLINLGWDTWREMGLRGHIRRVASQGLVRLSLSEFPSIWTWHWCSYYYNFVSTSETCLMLVSILSMVIYIYIFYQMPIKFIEAESSSFYDFYMICNTSLLTVLCGHICIYFFCTLHKLIYRLCLSIICKVIWNI